MSERSRRFSTTVLLALALLMVSYQQTSIAHALPLPTIGFWSEAYNSSDIVDPTIQPNSTVVVDINATNAPAFNGYDLTLYFDPTYLQTQFVNVRGGAFSNPFVGAEDISTGRIRLAVVNVGTPFTGGNGVLAQIDFNVTGKGVSPLALAAATTQPSGQAQSWTQLVYGYTEIPVTTADGYFSNVPGDPGPVASFTVSPLSPHAGDTLTFNGTGSFDPDNLTAPNHGIAIYSWDFGDGDIRNTTTPIITYTYQTFGFPYFPFSGNFSARLTVFDSDNHFEGMITRLVEVSPICVPGSITIDVPGDCPTIQAAIDSVAKGGTIQVAPGTYIEKPVIQKPLTLTGSGNMTILEGLIQVQAPNVTISGFRITSYPLQLGTGIELIGASGAIVRNNQVMGQRDPLNLETDLFHGITVFGSTKVLIQNNTVVDEKFGISLEYSSNSILRDNKLSNNAFNLDVSHEYAQNIDPSNTVNGRPVFYQDSGNNSQVPTNAGYIGIVNAHDLVVNSTDTSDNGQALLVVNSTRITISHLKALDDLTGAIVLNSNYIVLENSTIVQDAQAVDPFNCVGIMLANAIGNLLENDTFDCAPGMVIHRSSLNKIENSFVRDTVEVSDSQSNQFVRNHIGIEPYGGSISFENSASNFLINNTIIGGLGLDNSPDTTLNGNAINGSFEVSSIRFECDPFPASCRFDQQLPDYVQSMDPSNTVNGRPVYYLVNRAGLTVPTDAGFVAVVNSTDILVRNVSPSFNLPDVPVISSRNVGVFSNNLTGVSAWRDTNLTIASNAVSPSFFVFSRSGITVQDSSVGTITGNLISNSPTGISLTNSTEFKIQGNLVGASDFRDPCVEIDLESSSNNTVYRNTLLGVQSFCGPVRSTGIRLDSFFSNSSGNLLVGNVVANYFIGIDAGQSSGNTIYNNNFLNNTIQAHGGSGDTWNSQTGQGNFWSNYSGQDTDHDGIGDTMLPVLGLDNYPLMSEWTPSGLAARLAGRAAWPNVKRLSISKQGGNTQTLSALANNTGTAPEWVEAVFNVTFPNGSTIQFVTEPAWINLGNQIVFSVRLPVTPGSYRVNVSIKYSYDAYQGWIGGNSKSFSFQVVT